MTNYSHKPRGLPVPDGRLSRFLRLSGVAAGVAGSVAAHGSRQLMSGRRPQLQDLLLTPANASRLAKQLAQMRGAAMKMGQLISLEASDFLPREFTEILGELRHNAHFMPPAQLKKVLVAEWGPDFLKKFKRFDTTPLAAASIGQVHRALTRDGRDLAIKVQYPGVRNSIDSDVTNVAGLLRMSGVLPSEIDISPLMDEARRQLHEEADYEREGQMMTRYKTLLDGDPRFRVPKFHTDLTSQNILAMEFVPGRQIENLKDASQSKRNSVTQLLLELTLREMFEFGLMQTDPNFANFLYDDDQDQIVLLDFGATRDIPDEFVASIRALLHAGMAKDTNGVTTALNALGYLPDGTAQHHRDKILHMTDLVFEPCRTDAMFNFAHNNVMPELRKAGLEFGEARDFWVIPAMDLLCIQRKLGGMYLLGARLEAEIGLRPLLEPYLAP